MPHVKDNEGKAVAGRLYQLETIARVSERFTNKYRQSLIVQATGTGKTRVAIALSKLMIDARWVKRVLFLCDRKELRKQAANAFNQFTNEPLYVVGKSKKADRQNARIYIATYPGMMKIMDHFDVGYFDLIIADESHRSIYNVYGDLFKYFDALQIGLTATPIDMVSKTTFGLFGCEGRIPTANYSLEDAIADNNLVPYEVVTHTTEFLREGIKREKLSDAQIRELEEQGIDPNTLEFDGKALDEAIYNKDTNRYILRNLMENGLKDRDGQLPGKTIIFARNHKHALLLNELFDDMYPQFAGRFCQVIDNYDPRAEQLIDDFKGLDESTNKELTIAISVDMLDTGIDVPEIVNLVFAKPVKSKVKFWQMIGSHPNPCDRLNSWPNYYLEQYPRKIACYLASISKLDNFLDQLDGILRRHSRHFAMLYFSDHGLSVSDSANPVHHDGHVQGGYSVPLIITASDITSHQSVSRKISARNFAGIFQWLTGIRTENIPPFNPLTDEDNEPVMVFNGEKNVPADSLKPQPLILPDHR